jgi:hypothetical protein
MFIDTLGNLSVLRTLRVLRALKTVAVVPGKFKLKVYLNNELFLGFEFYLKD